MSAVDVLREAAGMRLVDEDGNVETLTLLPGLTEEELKGVEAGLPCALPAEAREVLTFCRGFEGGPLESVDFSGQQLAGFGLEEVFPCGVPIAHDGFGNYWVVDVVSTSKSWGPIFFACHDAPVIVFQTDRMEHFIKEVIRMSNEPWESEIDDVHEKYHDRISRDNPGVMTHEDCLKSRDADLRAFAESLDETFLFVDLRNAKVGDGFSWGRYGPATVNKRFGEERIFAYQIRERWWRRLFGKRPPQ